MKILKRDLIKELNIIDNNYSNFPNEIEIIDNLKKTDTNVENIKNIILSLFKNNLVFDGKETLQYMKSNGSKNFKQNEWPGFFIEEKMNTIFPKGRRYINTNFDFSIVDNNNIIDGDIKVHTTYKNSEKGSDSLVLNDISAFDMAIEKNGIFYLVTFGVHVRLDNETQDFKKWVLAEIKNKSEYSKKNENVPNRRTRLYKTGFLIQEIIITPLYVEDYKNIFGLFNQGVNSNGKPRLAKYSVGYSTLKDQSLIIDLKF